MDFGLYITLALWNIYAEWHDGYDFNVNQILKCHSFLCPFQLFFLCWEGDFSSGEPSAHQPTGVLLDAGTSDSSSELR